MNNALSTLAFNTHTIRVIDQDGSPWFVATDLYAILFGRTTGISARSFLKEDEQMLVQKVSASGALSSLFSGTRYRAALISESGLYKLAMRSDKPEARAFQDWVTRDVLPAIRKTGSYVMGEEKLDPAADDYIERLQDMLLAAKERKLAEAEAERHRAIAERDAARQEVIASK